MEELILSPETLFAIADIVDGYCSKQRETINVYYAQMMALDSEWRDDKTFGTIMQEISLLKNKAITALDEIYNYYPKYFRKRAQTILERPSFSGGTTEISTIESSSRPVGATYTGRGGYGGAGYGMGMGRTVSSSPLRTLSSTEAQNNTKETPASNKKQKIENLSGGFLKVGKDFEGSDESIFELELKEAGRVVLPQNGVWTGEKGNSDFYPDNPKSKRVLEYYGTDHVTYVNGVPDFSPFIFDEFADVTIDDFSIERYKNFQAADLHRASMQGVGGSDARSFRQTNRLTWHEQSIDGRMILIPYEVHSAFPHSGAISEAKKQQIERARNVVNEYRGLKLAKI